MAYTHLRSILLFLPSPHKLAFIEPSNSIPGARTKKKIGKSSFSENGFSNGKKNPIPDFLFARKAHLSAAFIRATSAKEERVYNHSHSWANIFRNSIALSELRALILWSRVGLMGTMAISRSLCARVRGGAQKPLYDYPEGGNHERKGKCTKVVSTLEREFGARYWWMEESCG